MQLFTQIDALLETERQRIPGGPTGWRPERLILRDWWHWRDQEFGFAHGRLALTGQNAGGKSSLLALTLPLLLDGKIDPIRLDPAQSRDRRIEYYLLGEGGSGAETAEGSAFFYEGRTGYIALEFYHAGRNEYLTIGRGFRASRHAPRPIQEHWGFFLYDGLRLGRGWDLRSAEGSCLERSELQRYLGEHGRVTTDLGEYQREVNTRLFGFERDGFRELIEILLKARRPKLGEQTGPEKVCDDLRSALPPVPEERLRGVSEVVHHLQEYQRNLADVAAKQVAIRRLDEALYQVAVALLNDAHRQYKGVQGSHGAAIRERRRSETELAETEERLAQLGSASLARTEEWTALQTEVEELRHREGSDLQERLGDKLAAQQRAERDLATAQTALAALQKQRTRRAGTATTEEEAFSRETRAMGTVLERLERESRYLRWAEAEEEIREARGAIIQLAVNDPVEVVAGAEVRTSLAGIAEELAGQFHQAGKMAEAVAEADRAALPLRQHVDALRETLRDLAKRQQAAEEALDQAVVVWLDQLAAWAERAPGLDTHAAVIEGISHQLDRLTLYPEHPRELLGPLYHWEMQRRSEIEAAMTELAQLERQQGAALLQAEAALQQELAQGDEPERSPLRTAARKALAASEVQPLYQVVRFKPDLPADMSARVEAALLEAGWLDLLVAPTLEGTAYDAILRPAPRQGASLLSLLETEAGAPDHVRQALASIGWGEGEGEYWIAPDGRWQNGPAMGQVEPWAPDQPEWIGEENRAAAYRARIERAEGRCAEIRIEIALLAAERQRLFTQSDQLTATMTSLQVLPWSPILGRQAALAALGEQEERCERDLTAAHAKLLEAEAHLRQQQNALDAARQGLPGAFVGTAHEYYERSYRFGRFGSDLHAIGSRHGGLLAVRDRYQAARIEESEAAQSVSAAQTEVGRKELECVAASEAVRVIQSLLLDPDLQRQAERLAWCKARILTLESENRDADGEQSTLDERRRHLRSDVAERREVEEGQRRTMEAALDRVRESLCRHPRLEPFLTEWDLVGEVAILPRLPKPEAEGEPTALVYEAIDALRDQLRRDEDLLQEYQPRLSTDRYTVRLTHRNAPVTAAALGERLAAESARYGELIQEEQKRLFEEIIFAQMLDELIRLMADARAFRDRVTKRLESLPLSNGEVLSLRLSLRSEEEEPGARIARALTESQGGATYMGPEQKRRLVDLIKAEVGRLETDGNLPYQEAVVTALDYRNWFQFQLLSKMEGQPATVIRNRGFGQRSTSAKAMALAVPIIAAVAARYDAARPDAPRVIGLDEAFAGFDANNQAIYLKYLSGLGLSWIVTIPEEIPYSQELSAVMAYRMELRGQLHTGFPILWNGQTTWEPLLELMGG